MEEKTEHLSVSAFITALSREVYEGCNAAHKHAADLYTRETTPLPAHLEIKLSLGPTGEVAQNKNEAVCEVNFSTNL